MRTITKWLMLAVLSIAGAQELRHSPILVGIHSLVEDRDGFALEDRFTRRRLTIPGEWLIPPDEPEGLGAAVTSLSYDEAATSFGIGDGKLGVHLSSYDIAGDGTTGAAAGRDVFLVVDSAFGEVGPGLIDLGITKSRVRHIGCFSAVSTRFLVADVNRDGWLDVGVQREELECRDVVRDDVDAVEGPFHVRLPVRWYVFDRDRWIHEPKLDATAPTGPSWELPLIGIIKTPIEFLEEGPAKRATGR